MAKGKRKSFNDPAKQLGALSNAWRDKALRGMPEPKIQVEPRSGWKKGTVTKIEPGGVFTVDPKNYMVDPAVVNSSVYQKAYNQYMQGVHFMSTPPRPNNFFKQEYDAEFKEPKKPETATDWADKWVEENETKKS